MIQEKQNNVIDEEQLDEQCELLIVRNLRLKINKALVVDGVIPSDPEKLDFLMKNLKDMDTSAIARSRIKSEEKTSNNNAVTIGMVTNVLQALRGGKALPPEDISDVEEPGSQAPTLPSELDNFTFNKGETSIGTITEDVATFTARMNRESPE